MRVVTKSISLLSGPRLEDSTSSERGPLNKDTSDFNVWAFELDLPEVPHKSWDAIKRSFTQDDQMTAVKDTVFPAVRELWRFAVSTPFHAI